jgi:hypothetical protein
VNTSSLELNFIFSPRFFSDSDFSLLHHPLAPMSSKTFIRVYPICGVLCVVKPQDVVLQFKSPYILVAPYLGD